ncbi:MAG TPA: HAD-IA family hydrolase [Vicinamibacterales bacterium]
MGHLQRRLIAFDLDGTLIDSSRDLADSVNELLGTLGAPALPLDEVTRMIGEGAKVLIRRALAASGIPEDPAAIARFLDIYDRRLLDHTVPYAGIPEIVRAAREHARVAVLTNKPLAPSEKVLAGLGMRDLFDEVIGSDGTYPRKPDPTALLALMERAGATPDRTLMIGDSKIDYDTAKGAAARCCLVGYGFTDFALHARALAPDAWIASDTGGLADAIARFIG